MKIGSLEHRLDAATADLDPPLAALDVSALRRNATSLVARAGGVPIRLASKSLRCRWVLDEVLSRPGFHGVMAYSLAEANWLVRSGVTDVLVGYPTAHRAALRELVHDERLLAEITLMVDGTDQLDFIAAVVAETPGVPAPIRICLDVDASLRIGPLHLGVRRSPVRSPTAAARLARECAERRSTDGRPLFRPVGVMFYEAQIAGLPDSSAAVRLVKRRSAAELAERRAAVTAAVTAAGAELQFVNSGGTGSLEVSGADPVVTELTAGSGLYCPTLFDGYDAFEADPALFFALPVVRRPSRRIATAFGGGYIASGPSGRSRLPGPLEDGLTLLSTEGAGEVQTPIRGRALRGARTGDRVWFRPAKAGEVLERFNELVLVEGSQALPECPVTPTYRGEGRNFG